MAPFYAIPWEWIVDESREMERSGGWKDLGSYAKVIEQSYKRDFWAHQKNHLIVISEKATVSGILRPVLQQYGIPFFPVHGFNSATKMHELAEEIAADERRTVLLYCGDFDPSGMFMSVVDVPKRLGRYGAGDSYILERIALPKAMFAAGASRSSKPKPERKIGYAWFLKNYGQDCCELDAMDPNELRDRVTEKILEYVNPADWQKHKRIA